MQDRKSVRLLETRRLVEEYGNKNGLDFSKALRNIIKKYFEFEHATAIKKYDNSDLKSIKDDLNDLQEDFERFKNDMDELKFNVDVILKMLLVIGNNDEELRSEFIHYFPRYFKESD